MHILQNSQGDFDHRQSGQQWPQVLRVSKGPFRLPEAERSGSFSCPRPRLGGGVCVWRKLLRRVLYKGTEVGR